MSVLYAHALATDNVLTSQCWPILNSKLVTLDGLLVLFPALQQYPPGTNKQTNLSSAHIQQSQFILKYFCVCMCMCVCVSVLMSGLLPPRWQLNNTNQKETSRCLKATNHDTPPKAWCCVKNRYRLKTAALCTGDKTTAWLEYMWQGWMTFVCTLQGKKKENSRTTHYFRLPCVCVTGPGIESRWGRISRTRPDRRRGPSSLLYNWYIGSLSLGSAVLITHPI